MAFNLPWLCREYTSLNKTDKTLNIQWKLPKALKATEIMVLKEKFKIKMLLSFLICKPKSLTAFVIVYTMIYRHFHLLTLRTGNV